MSRSISSNLISFKFLCGLSYGLPLSLHRLYQQLLQTHSRTTRHTPLLRPLPPPSAKRTRNPLFPVPLLFITLAVHDLTLPIIRSLLPYSFRSVNLLWTPHVAVFPAIPAASASDSLSAGSVAIAWCLRYRIRSSRLLCGILCRFMLHL